MCRCPDPFAARLAGAVLALAAAVWPGRMAADVLTQHNDERRSGADLDETILNTSDVRPGSFGKIFAYETDGYVFAQPLYCAQLALTGHGTRDVLFICTMEDTVYAFDAKRDETLWSVHLDDPEHGITPVPVTDITRKNTLNIHGDVGILSTPVIDRSAGAMYVLARTKNRQTNTYIQTLHALDLATGADKMPPVVIDASMPGTGKGSKDGILAFDPKKESQRPALALADGNIIVAWASHEDIGPYHGWIMAYRASDLKQVAVFNATPDGEAGGVWQAGEGPTVDDAGSVYLLTGNGDWDGSRNFGCSFLKLRGSDLKLLDWFTPDGKIDYPANLNAHDWDVGSTGALLIPGSEWAPGEQGSPSALVLGGSKEGMLYVCRTDSLGHSVPDNTQIVQAFQAVYWGPATHHLQGSPIYWNSSKNGPTVYLWGESDYCRAFKATPQGLQVPAFSTSRETAPMVGVGQPGGILSLSADGNKSGTGILWANCTLSGDSVHDIVPGVLRAYDAEDLTRQLWNSHIDPADDIGLFAKFVPPSVADGRVYMATFSGTVNVYGLK
jgi:hypothetical protein